MTERRGPDAEVDEDGTTETVVEPALPRPSRTMTALSGIERFTLLRKLGQGGMGTVYAAYDGLLDRKVAVKVVRANRRNTSDPVSPRDQLLREAQAMARLAHPNVVTVHEVGELGDDVYVVIELVDGTTLQDWLKERARPWRDIVGAFVQAGHGLAAAHDAGLVHRDFKPNNVLVRRDGRIQVTDFGVVSMGGSPDTPGPDGAPPAVSDITFTGRRVGTPAYMAPEQYAGESVDGRADQFSFSVALWEALYGVRPFAPRTEEPGRAIRDRPIQAPPASTRVPRWIEAVLRRGLSARPDDRWSAMEEMLDALARDPARARRQRVAIAAGIAGVLAIAAIAWIGGRTAAAEPCAGADAHLLGRWDAERRAALETAFLASKTPFAPAAAGRVRAQLDRWTATWVTARVETCRATRVVGDQSEALLDARMHCLDRQLDEVTQLAAALVTSDPAIIVRAAQDLPLPDVVACGDRDGVIARVPPPATPGVRDRVSQLEHELAGVRALAGTGHYHEARTRAAAAVAAATALGFAPLTAEAMLARGELEEQDGDLAAARETLAEAARVAASARDDRTVARALVDLIGVLVARGEVPAALALGIAATASATRAGPGPLDAELVEQLGAAHDAAGDAEAETHLRRALALREASEGPDSIAVAQVLNRLAGLWSRRGRTAEARAGYERALAIVTTALGPAHPATAVARANVCYLDAEAGELEPARACQEAVLATLEQALGDAHPQVAWALNEVALVQRAQGDVAGAEPRFARALAIWETSSGVTHVDVAWPLINLGEISNTRGDHARAEALCRRALTVIEGSARPADAAPALACLGEALVPRAPREAIALARRGLDLLAAQGEGDTAALAFTLARAQAAAGDRRAAIATAREAVAHATAGDRARIEAWLRTAGR